MKRLTRGKDVYALVLSGDDFQPGAKFVSESDWPLQVGLMTLPAKHAIAPHAHLPRDNPRIQPTQEFLFVFSGKMEVDFFDETGQYFQTEVLRQGEILIHIRGGHAFRFPESTRLVEVKSGPYLGREKDKVFLQMQSSATSPVSGNPVEGSRNNVDLESHSSHPSSRTT